MNIIALTEEQFKSIQRQLKEMQDTLNLRADQERIYDNADLMELLNVSARTLATWRENGTIRYSKIGSKIYYRQQDIQAMLEEGLQNR